MPGTNFDLAPPAKVVDGLLAVPIDIEGISAHLVFDGATGTASGEATVDFTMGPQAGHPIFDLRQTITGCWLDGAPVAVAQTAHHDFGGGPNAELRVVQAMLAAGSAHTLRVTYTLGLPQAPLAGSYPPGLTWSPGPRLAFNFGFTDLRPGRYLEAWIPANLIYDQFGLTLELQVLNTAVAHAVITNGVVTPLGSNHWSVAFPARFTALSALLEVRATDTLASMNGTVTLPLSGTIVTIEAWKLAASAIDLGTEIGHLQAWLAANETVVGRYLHGNRFVTFLNVGGMEYEGGTTSGPGALRHETFHSWFARGLKPASQPDAWWDEAWTVYNDHGAIGSFPFDFGDPPVELRPPNPWARVTVGGAYSSGERFFEGAAAMTGVAALKAVMSDLYRERNGRPLTTADLEAFLVSRSGQPELVDAFHRFVYGFGDPAPAPDLWLRDDPADPGANFWAGRFWDSPDLWIRNADDGGTVHQAVESGQDNWFYARVRNRGTTAARHVLVTFNVKPFAGIQFQYLTDFLPCVAAAAAFDLAPGASTIVKARWPAALVPPPGTHACLLAAAIARLDHPAAGGHVWEHNNLAQKNLTVVNLFPDDWLVLPFVIRPAVLRPLRPTVLELIRPGGRETLQAALLHRRGTSFPRLDTKRRGQAGEGDEEGHLDCGGGPIEPAVSDAVWTSRAPQTRAALRFGESEEMAFDPGRVARLPVVLRGPGQAVMALRLHVPRDAKAGEVIALDIVQRSVDDERILGGLAVQIHVLKPRAGDRGATPRR